MTREEAHTLLEVMAINITGELAGSGHIITDQTKLLAKQLKAIDMAIEALSEPKVYTEDDYWNGKVPQDGDLIRRADAMGAVQDHFNDDGFKGYNDGQKMINRIKMLPPIEPRDVMEWYYDQIKGEYNIKLQPQYEKHQLSEETPTLEVDTPTKTSTDLISRAKDDIAKYRTWSHTYDDRCNDLISRADAIDFVTKLIWNDGETWNDVQDRIVDGIKALPSADRPSEEKLLAEIKHLREQNNQLDELYTALSANTPDIVRCKDCKWWSGSANTSHNNHLCKRALDQNVEYWTRGDDFCSYGERKGGEE